MYPGYPDLEDMGYYVWTMWLLDAALLLVESLFIWGVVLILWSDPVQTWISMYLSFIQGE